MELLIIGIFWIVVLGGVGYWIAQQKRRSEVEGAALGCLLGPIGWIIEAVLPTGDVVSSQPQTVSGRPASVPPKPKPKPPADEWTLGPKGGGNYTRPVTDDLIVPWEESDDSRRPEQGPDGSPPIKRRYMEGSPEAAIEAMRADERTAGANRVVEAVWENLELSHLAAAFGDPKKTYDLVWPDKPRVRLDSPDVASRAEEAPTEPAAPTASSVKPAAPIVAAGAGDARPTKTCPDCAETILEAARICRFCRYEFWPVDAPPEPAIDVPEADEPASPPDDSSTTDEVPDTGTRVTAEDASPQPEPEPQAPEPDAPAEQVEPLPPPAPPPGYAPPPQSYPAPSPAGQPAPPPYPPQQPPYPPQQPPYPPQQPPYPPPPGWQPPPQGQPPGQVPPPRGPWVPPPPRPPDQPRE